MSKNKTHTNPEILYQERLDKLGIIALNVIESLITDTETSIDGRLKAAFRLIEVYESDKIGEGIAKAINDSIQSNKEILTTNADRLTKIESFCNRFKDKTS